MSIVNEHSKKYFDVKKFFENGFWNEMMVNNAIGRWITEEEAKEILGKDEASGD